MLRATVLLLGVGLLLLAVPAPAAAILCSPTSHLEDPRGYVDCQYGCELGALQRFLATHDPHALSVACPA